jgi:hypothetical protein
MIYLLLKITYDIQFTFMFYVYIPDVILFVIVIDVVLVLIKTSGTVIAKTIILRARKRSRNNKKWFFYIKCWF